MVIIGVNCDETAFVRPNYTYDTHRNSASCHWKMSHFRCGSTKKKKLSVYISICLNSSIIFFFVEIRRILYNNGAKLIWNCEYFCVFSKCLFNRLMGFLLYVETSESTIIYDLFDLKSTHIALGNPNCCALSRKRKHTLVISTVLLTGII